MPRVKLSKVLDRLDTEARYAMADALQDIGVPGTARVDPGALARAFFQRLESRASTYVRVPDSAVVE